MHKKRSIGPYGPDNQNEKVETAVQFSSSNNLRVANTFYNHKNYTTYVSQLANGGKLMLDVISMLMDECNHIQDCKLFRDSHYSNHTGVIVEILLASIKHTGEKRLACITEPA